MDKITGFNLNRKIEFSKKTIISLVISLVYAVLLIILVAHHEPFCDEINIFMVINDQDILSSLNYIIKNGNSLLFYLIIFPLVKSGFSIQAVQAFCALISVPAVFILNRFSPFGSLVNLIITFSTPMIYFFPVIARPYCLIPVVIISGASAIAALKNDKEKKVLYCIAYSILVIAVSQIHIIMFGFAASLTFLFLYDILTHIKTVRLSEKIAFLSMIFSLCTVVAQAYIALRNNYVYSIEASGIHINSVLYSFLACFFDPSQAGYNVSFMQFHSGIVYFFIVFAIILSLFGTYCLFCHKFLYGLSFLVSVLFPLYIYLTKYPIIMANRVYMFHLVFLFLLWIAFSENKLPEKTVSAGKILIAVLFALMLPSGIIFARADYSGYFSAGRNMADFIEQNIPDDGKTMIFAEQPWQGLPVAYYLKNRPIYNIDGKRLVRIENYLPKNNIREISKDKDFMFVIVSSNHFNTRKMLESEGFRLMYTTPPAIMPYESYSLYAARL